MRSIKFSSRVGKNVSHMENLDFLSRVEEISTRYAELKFLHVIAMSF